MRESVPHLHASSGFSARYGASHPHDLVARASERGIGALALTDRDMVTGTVRFAKAAAAVGVKPLFGVDLGIAPHAPFTEARRRTPVRGGAHVAEAPFRATFLARDAAGWARLCRLVS
ncbi:PHP domain-containing protein, partial [Streptomyces rubiginosohelvolus]